MRHRLFYLLLCGPALLCGQIDPTQALLEIRRQVAASTNRLPNYMCTETVERETFQPSFSVRAHNADSCDQIIESAAKSPNDFKLASIDRLRLDVALGGAAEMYSWVGEGRFDDRALSEIVKQGTTSTGAFGSFLHAIFVSDAATFSFKGESQLAGRQVLEYGFEVPITRSGYIVSNQTLNRVTAYSGKFTADANTFDLLRLEIRTDQLAPELEICQSTTTLDYTKARMSGVNVLLPSEANVRMLANNGRESHNRTVFSGCHQFLGESKLIFDDPPASAQTPASASAKSKTVTLSDGLKVSVALTQSIDPATAAAGDPVTGRLTRPIKDQSIDLTIPKGAKVNGRVFGLLSVYVGGNNLEFALKWESIELDGVSHPLDLSLKGAISGSAKLPVIRGHFPEIRSGLRAEQRGVGFFLFPEVFENYQIPAGFETEWVTLPALPSSK
jgi:hypothetical protein